MKPISGLANPLRVLVAHPVETVRNLVAAVVEANDMAPMGVATYDEAVVMLSGGISPDVIVVGYELPPFTAGALLRALPELPDRVETIVLSAVRSFSIASEVLKVGASDLVIEDADLAEAVGSSLERVRSRCLERRRSEERRRQVEHTNRRYEQILHLTGTGTWRSHADRVFLDRRAAHLLGLRHHHAGHTLTEIVALVDTPARESVRLCLEGRAAGPFSTRFKLRSARRATLPTLRLAGGTDRTGRVYGTLSRVGFVRPAESSNDTLDEISVALVRLNPQGKIERLTPSAAELMGETSTKRLLGRRLPLHPASEVRIDQLVEVWQEQEEPDTTHLVLRRRGGEPFEATAYAHAIFDESGALEGVDLSLWPAQEWSRVSSSLRDREKRYLELRDMLPQGILGLEYHGDLEGAQRLTIIEANAAARELLSPNSEATGEDLELLSDRSLETLAEALEGIFLRDESFRGVLPLESRSGQGIPLVVDGRRWGRPNVALVTLQDAARSLSRSARVRASHDALEGHVAERTRELQQTLERLAQREWTARLTRDLATRSTRGKPAQVIEEALSRLDADGRWKVHRDEGEGRTPLVVGDDPVAWIETPAEEAAELVEEVGQQLSVIVAHLAAEQALISSEELFRAAFAQAPIGIVVEEYGTRLNANEAVLHLLGLTDAEQLRSLDDLIDRCHPEDAGVVGGLIESARMRQLEVAQTVARYVRVDGTVVWSNTHVRGPQGHDRVLLLLEDVTERKRSESALRDSERRFRAIFDNAPQPMCLLDRQGTVIELNAASADLLERGDAAMHLFQPFWKLPWWSVVPKSRKRLEAAVKKARRGSRLMLELDLWGPDAEVHQVEVSLTPFLGQSDRGDYLVASLVDVTAVKSMLSDREMHLKRTRERVRQLDALNQLSLSVQRADTMEELVEAAVQCIATANEQVSATIECGGAIAKSERLERTSRSVRVPIAGEQKSSGYIEAWWPLDSSVGLPRSEQRGFLEAVAAFLALSVERIESERETIAARRDAERASQAKSVFLANMSHEIRTPINVMLGFTQLIARDPGLTDAQRDRIRRILLAGEHLMELTTNLLDMSKIEAGRLELTLQPFDLWALVDQARAMFEPIAAGKGLVLTVTRASQLPRHVRGDRGKLRQILSNLLSNACKFTREGSVELRVSGRAGRVLLEVEDTGIGIPETEMAMILQPFKRGKLTAGQTRGTGLGLALSCQLAALMGAELRCESTLGQGSRFSLELELEAAEPRAARTSPTLARIKVPTCALVVDDEPDNRIILGEMLSGFGFEVIEAVDGHEGVEAWRTHRPELVMMDLAMPRLSGQEATRVIRAETEGGHVSIIAVTAHAFGHHREEALEAGVDAFLAKPVSEQALLDALYDALGADRFEPVEGGAAVESEGLVAWAGGDLDLDSVLVGEARQAVVDATAAGEHDRLLRLADALGESHQEAAAWLRAAAQRYDYESILWALAPELHAALEGEDERLTESRTS